MSGRHGPRPAALGDAPRTAVGRQTGPVGVIGLERRDGDAGMRGGENMAVEKECDDRGNKKNDARVATEATRK